MDFHPLIVHFPIALLTAYCALEFLRFEKLKKHASWFYLKLFLLGTGAVSAVFARQTGEFTGGIYGESMWEIVRAHSLWATGTTLFFLGLAFAYAVKWLEKDFADSPLVLKLKYVTPIDMVLNILNRAASFILSAPIILILAALGFLMLSVTGALGSILVRGPESDIFASFIYRLFF